ncbi:hypothetical protein OIDMADRAFT_31181 [Oidiodendron maius Zn]|uniref:Uncharacterized protein n=1 Tax=Oidiodendron maius (strain Zn) TaxID=913774 RepID=A0A0C3CHB7_OIDMZ|nr:hypothetical protein OIDMADRAFT_31181 [Oidiodendron maius Zn]
MSSTTISQLDLAARSIDLCTTLLKWNSSANIMADVVCEISCWLGREKLSRSELQDCLQKARHLARPNHTTEDFFQSLVVVTGRKSTTMPLFTQPSGSLGRLIVDDSQLCWMVSTVACLFQYHDEQRVNDCIRILVECSERESKEDGPISELPTYDPSKAHFGRVLKKIISSIWFNVVNCGHTTMSLPEELLAVCRAGHNLSTYILGMFISKLKKSRSRVMVRSTHLLRNFTHWVLLHYDGDLRVVVERKIVYERRLGNSGNEIEIRVSTFCDDFDSCDKKDTCEMIEDVAGREKLFCSGRYQSRSEFPERPMVRRMFYEFAETVQIGNKSDRETMASRQAIVRGTAQKLMRWLLFLDVYPLNNISNLGFAVSLGDEDRPGSICKVLNLLHRSPGILNRMWGDVPRTKVIYSGASGTRLHPDDDLLDPRLEPDRTFTELLSWFPILGDMIQEVKQHCRCLRCDEAELLPGCLCYSAMVDCLVVLAHGLADGFGAVDTSGIRDKVPLAMGMLQILLDLVEYEGILWQTWFGLAAAVTLGCNCPGIPTRTFSDMGSSTITTLVAVQYGNMAVVAPWIDLTKKLHIRGCFRLIETEGKLGIPRPMGKDQWVFKGIEEDYALVWTEMTEPAARGAYHLDTEEPPGTADAGERDTSRAESDNMLIQREDNLYSLLTRIRADNHSRIIDPADALIRLAKGNVSTLCHHHNPKDTFPANKANCVTTFDFDHLVRDWPKWDHYFRFQNPDTEVPLSDNEDEDDEEVEAKSKSDEVEPVAGDGAGEDQMNLSIVKHVTHSLDSYLKQNVALALSVNGDLCNNNEPLCIECTTLYRNKDTPRTVKLLKGRVFYVINVDGHLSSSSFVTKMLKS